MNKELFDIIVHTDVLSFSNFIEVIKKIKQSYPDKLLDLPWQEYQHTLSDSIIESLNELKHTESSYSEVPSIPSEGLKGVYFCLGDDGLSFCVAGSLYFNETDWAANAFFYPGEDHRINKLFFKISDELEELKLNKDETEELMYMFCVFTINKTLESIKNINEIANAGIGIGYCDRDELLLGNFVKNKFVKDIRIIEDGEYENPSSFKEVEVHNEPRGVLWDYLHWNYGNIISEHGLSNQFYQYGEQEAERIANQFKESIFINRCNKCNFIKKTPRARLCLNCGDFIETEDET